MVRAPTTSMQWACRVVLTTVLAKDTLLVAWMRGWKVEIPAQPCFAYDCEGWDEGAIVEYSPINLGISTSTRPISG